MIPEYRVWAGFSLWIGATIYDFYLTTTGFYPSDRWVGIVSLAGFGLALAWAMSD